MSMSTIKYDATRCMAEADVSLFGSVITAVFVLWRAFNRADQASLFCEPFLEKCHCL